MKHVILVTQGHAILPWIDVISEYDKVVVPGFVFDQMHRVLHVTDYDSRTHALDFQYEVR